MGSGKSTVASFFAGMGAKTIDADGIGHELLSPGKACFRSVVRNFGKGILKNGKIDRAKLGAIVFKKRKALAQLERIIHPAVRREILAQIRRNKKSVWVVDVPLLFEAGFDRFMDRTVVVTANRDKQIDRAVKKLNITRAEALQRIQRQMPQAQKIRRADFIIDNNGNISQTKQQVKRIWQKIQLKTKN